MSRVGRNYLQVGFYAEVLFQEKGVHFIAISNGVDSEKRESAEFAPFLNTMNEWYVRDTSRKITTVLRAKYDKKHKESLAKYPELKERMQSLLQQGEKITPKQWKAEIQSLQAEYNSINKEKSKTEGQDRLSVFAVLTLYLKLFDDK